MVESTSAERKFHNSFSDWILRAVIFTAFLFFGTSKFSSDPTAPWAVLFNHVGFGQWFRYFTAVLEILGAFLALIPQTVTAGLGVLASTMTGAVLIDMIVLRQPADAFIPFAILCAFIALWLHRRRI